MIACGLRISSRGTPFRRVLAAEIASLLLWMQGAGAAERLPPAAAPESPSLPQLTPLPRIDAGPNNYQIAAIAAGVVVGVIAANFVTRGMLTPILAIGTGMPEAAPASIALPSATQAATIVVIIAAHVTGLAPEMILVAGAPALVSVGGPVDAALRDGYTTPTVLLEAFGESASRAGSMIVAAGSYVSSTASAWLNGP